VSQLSGDSIKDERPLMPFFAAMFVAAFGLNWLWEMFQMPAFAGMAGRPWRETALVCALASVGDAVITLAVYGAGALARGLTPLEDQALGGAIMWIVAGAVDMTAVLVVLFRFFGASTARAMPRSLTRLDACVTIDRFHDR
jgi:cytochrome c oxidase assembly factor CtaG